MGRALPFAALSLARVAFRTNASKDISRRTISARGGRFGRFARERGSGATRSAMLSSPLAHRPSRSSCMPFANAGTPITASPNGDGRPHLPRVHPALLAPTAGETCNAPAPGNLNGQDRARSLAAALPRHSSGSGVPARGAGSCPLVPSPAPRSNPRQRTCGFTMSRCWACWSTVRRAATRRRPATVQWRCHPACGRRPCDRRAAAG